MTSLLQGDYWLVTVSSLLGTLVNLALDVTLLIVGLTTVRRAKKSAGGLVATVGGASVVLTCLTPLLSFGAQRFVDHGSGSFQTVVAMQTMLGVVVHAALQGLLIAALVQLSRPMARDPREPELG